jgi:hypothetical protein
MLLQTEVKLDTPVGPCLDSEQAQISEISRKVRGQVNGVDADARPSSLRTPPQCEGPVVNALDSEGRGVEAKPLPTSDPAGEQVGQQKVARGVPTVSADADNSTTAETCYNSSPPLPLGGIVSQQSEHEAPKKSSVSTSHAESSVAVEDSGSAPSTVSHDASSSMPATAGGPASLHASTATAARTALGLSEGAHTSLATATGSSAGPPRVHQESTEVGPACSEGLVASAAAPKTWLEWLEPHLPQNDGQLKQWKALRDVIWFAEIALVALACVHVVYPVI